MTKEIEAYLSKVEGMVMLWVCHLLNKEAARNDYVCVNLIFSYPRYDTYDSS
jgi:hypothetical protein